MNSTFSIVRKEKSNKFQKLLALFAVTLFALLFSNFTFAHDIAHKAFSVPDAGTILNTNTSVHVLYQLFGPLINSVLGSDTSTEGSMFLFARMLKHWNSILITGCAIFFIYHLVLGIFKSAESGTFMGRDQGEKSSTIFRVVLGPFLMAPIIQGGYCIAQWVIMWLILCGVNLANYVWSETTNDIKMGATPTLPDGITSTLNNAAAELYLYSSLNNILEDLTSGQKETSGKLTQHTTDTVLLQDYPAFESVGHALMNTGSYFYIKNNKIIADDANYPPVTVRASHNPKWIIITMKAPNFGHSEGYHNPSGCNPQNNGICWVGSTLTIRGPESPQAYTFKEMCDSQRDMSGSELAMGNWTGCESTESEQLGYTTTCAAGTTQEILPEHTGLVSWIDKPRAGTNEDLGCMISDPSSDINSVKSYKPGEWILSGVEFTPATTGETTGITSLHEFELKVLNGAGVPADYDGTNRINNREKALIAPLGFNLMSVPSDWLIPILAQSSSSLYFASKNPDDNITGDIGMNPYDNYNDNLPLYKSYSSFNPGGLDCRKYIGQSSPQSYQLTGYSQKVTNTNDMPSDDKNPIITSRVARGVLFNDPDHDYKTCLINQLVNVLARTKTDDGDNFKVTTPRYSSAGMANPPYISDDITKNPFGINNLNFSVDSFSAEPKYANSIVQYWYYNTIANQSKNLVQFIFNNNLGGIVASLVGIQGASWNFMQLPGSDLIDTDADSLTWPASTTITPSMWSSNVYNKNVDKNDNTDENTNGSINFLSSGYGMADQKFIDALNKYDNKRCTTLVNILGEAKTATYPTGFTNNDGQKFFGAIQECLGYGHNITLFNNYMDMGQLLKDQGQPNFPGSGQLQIYPPNEEKNNKYAQGLLESTSTVDITSSGFNSAVADAKDFLESNEDNNKITGSLNLDQWKLDNSKWIKEYKDNKLPESEIDWSPFVNAILNASAPDLDSGEDKMYLPGSGYYTADSNGFLVNSSGEQLWDPSLNDSKKLIKEISGAENAEIYQLDNHTNDYTGWMIRPAPNASPIPLGIPVGGKAYKNEYNGDAPDSQDGITMPYSDWDKLTTGTKDAFDNSIESLCPPNGETCTFNQLTSFYGGTDSNVSWWNIGRSYLVLNKKLADNVQKLVDKINNTLEKANIQKALDAVTQPFVSTGAGFSVEQSQTLKYDVKMTGGIAGTLNLSYVPASDALGIASPQDSGSLTQPLSRNFLMLAVMNKPFVKSIDGNKLPSLDGLNKNPLVNELNGLPDNLLKPFEYLALYYRIKFNGPDYNNPLPNGANGSDKAYDEMIEKMNTMVDALKNNGLISDDAAPASSSSAKMFSTIGSALSSLYKHITPSQVGGGSLAINPLQIENMMQRIYSFGGASGSLESSSAMVGKQYDFLTQIQQIGVSMVGTVVGNLYDIGGSYTNTFNNNSALLDDNLTEVSKGYTQIQQASSAAAAKAENQMPKGDVGVSAPNGSAMDAWTYSALGLAAAGGAATLIPNVGRGGVGIIGVAAIGLQVQKTYLQVQSAKNQNAMAEYSQKVSEANKTLLEGQLDNQKQTINMQQKMIELQKMSYKMSTNLIQAMMMLPLAFLVLTMMFTTGIQFALIIPMTPYIIFWAGQTSWLLNTIEAMVAAPLLGFALLLPGGHGQYGHTIPAVRMLLNVVLKPALMVFGAIASMVLVYIIVVYSAQGFHMMGDSLVGSFFTGFDYGTGANGALKDYDKLTNVRAILSLMLIFMYATFLTMVFNKCFSIIYLIPEKVVQWLGGQSDSFGKEEAQQMTQATQQQAGQVAQAGQQSAQNVASGAKEMTGAKSQEASKIGSSNLQMAGTQSSMLGTQQSINSTDNDKAQAQGQENNAFISKKSSTVQGITDTATMAASAHKLMNP